MAAKRIISASADWAAFAARVPENQLANFTAFKGKTDVYVARVSSLPESLPKIDFAKYKSLIAVPGMVDDFQKNYEAMVDKIPYPRDTYSQMVTEIEKAGESETKKFLMESEQRIAEYQKQITRFNAMIPLELMTMEEYAEEFPELVTPLHDKPTFWPHTADCQPENIPDEEEEH